MNKMNVSSSHSTSASRSAPRSAHDSEGQRPNHKHVFDSVDFGEDVDVAVGATAVAFAGDQLVKAVGSKHQTSHLLKAGVGAVVAVGALAMFRRDHQAKHHGHRHDDQRDHQAPSARESRSEALPSRRRPAIEHPERRASHDGHAGSHSHGGHRGDERRNSPRPDGRGGRRASEA